jgi:hypothetical protein
MPVPEIIDTVFAKTSPKLSFSMTEYERFGLVFTKTRFYKFGHWKILNSDPTAWICNALSAGAGTVHPAASAGLMEEPPRAGPPVSRLRPAAGGLRPLR